MKSPLTRREKRILAHVQAHPVAWQLRRIVQRCGGAEMSPTQWLRVLDKHADATVRDSKVWQRTPNQLGRTLAELAPGLLLLEIEVSNRRTGRGRFWRIESRAFAVRRRHQESAHKEWAASRRAQQAGVNAEIAAVKAYLRRCERKKA